MSSIVTLIVDIDGTLCVNDGPFGGPLPPGEYMQRLAASGLDGDPSEDNPAHAREAERVAGVAPIDHVWERVRRFAERRPVWYLSGRPEWLRPSTERWLDRLGARRLPGFRGVVLRPTADRRLAETVKLHLFQLHILPAIDAPLHTVGLLDDRIETRIMFEQAGLLCLDPHDAEALARLDTALAGG